MSGTGFEVILIGQNNDPSNNIYVVLIMKKKKRKNFISKILLGLFDLSSAGFAINIIYKKVYFFWNYYYKIRQIDRS